MNWLWLKESFQGPDGKASHKKLSVLVLMCLYILVILYSVMAAFGSFGQVPEYIVYSIETMALLFSGINTIQSIKQKDHGKI